MEPYMIRFAGPGKKYRDPRKEKERDFRRGIRADHYDKESTWARRRWNRMNRNRVRQAIRNARDIEGIEVVPLKKTSGWWTH
jgi:hypothetical protein